MPPPRRASFLRTTPPPSYREKVRRRRRTQVAVLAAAALVVGLTAVPAWNALHDQTSGGPPTVSEGTTPGPPEASSATTPAADLTWVDHDGTLLPTSAIAGPSRQDGPLDVGFANSDLGAVIAAVHIAYTASPQPGPATFRAALATQVVGDDRDQLLVALERDYAGTRAEMGLTDGAPLPPGDATLLGYRVSALPTGNRHVQLVVTAPAADGSTQVYASDVVMTWQDGDWRLVAPSSGTWDSAVSRLPDVPADVIRFDPPQPASASLGGDR